MLRDEYKLLVEEKEKKPNRYMARALLFCLVLTISGWILNEVGVYRIDPVLMRVSSAFSCLACLIPTFIIKNEKWISNPICKYVLMGFILIPTFMAVAALNFHVTLLLVFPLLMVTQYRSKRLFFVTFVTTCLCTIVATYVSYKARLWDPAYVEMLYQFSSKQDIVETLPTIVTDSETLVAIAIYLIMPKIFIIGVLGFIIYGIVKQRIEDIDNRVHIIHLNETDLLTDVMNRNMYEMRIHEYKETCLENVVCVFADANGLHEINNEKGHSAGDELLKCVANAFKNHFEKEDIFRIGGDEFVVFIKDTSLDEVNARIRKVEDEIRSAQYYVSIGTAQIDKTGEMETLIQDAETLMYQAKKLYYVQTGKERRRRADD